ncbi:hypothetical protein QAD02_015513 [Eretmocerus hayati]|uniref:Uncharacterized protein n=1 Tax=Eretmocerus hayati TaxID=131215 RepID=A0ACC2P9Q4_9HYME|nr:hypothetical protein QAD02_015513 [Eretmocerus hayati]
MLAGRIVVGSSHEADIQLGGNGIEYIHCIIENSCGSVTLHPLSGSTCIDGHRIASPQRLTQGCMLTIGQSNYLRFNHPAEAKQLKRSNSQRSNGSTMTYNGVNGSNGYSNGITTSEPQNHHQQQSLQIMDRKPPVAPPHRSSPRGSNCSDDEVNFLGKLSKFEMLARQARANCVSPKVFPSGSLTTNVPADQILGHSRSSSLVSLGAARSSAPSPFQNLTNSMDQCRHGNDEQQYVNGMQQSQQQQQVNL